MAAPDETPLNFPDLPPFPSDIPTAPLLRLSLAALRKPAPSAESSRLWTAATTVGFFYLDLRGDEEGEAVLREAGDMFQLDRDLFELGGDELSEYDYSSKGSYMGYKGLGNKVVDATGKKDRNEFYNIPKDRLVNSSTTANGNNTPPLPHPPFLQSKLPLLKSYTTHAHSILSLLLTHLAFHLKIPPSALHDLHSLTLSSGDHIRLIKSPPADPGASPPSASTIADLSMGAHTDFGTLTLLMNRLGGLQVLIPSDTASSSSPLTSLSISKLEGEFVYVRPLPFHALLNLGDALVAFTSGVLKSNVHRVVAPPGAQGTETRYSVVYFMRPGDGVAMGPLPGLEKKVNGAGGNEETKVVSAKDWIKAKAMEGRVIVGEAGGKD